MKLKTKFYIYHIPGVKVGVTTKIKHRKYLYRRNQGKDYELEILEVLENKSVEEVGDREWYWADKFGYPRGTHYKHVRIQYHGKMEADNEPHHTGGHLTP